MKKGKELKQAKVYKVELDRERTLTFDFNALCELQDFYFDPFQAITGLQTMDVQAMRAILYAMLVAGQAVEDEEVEFDLTLKQVGRLLGSIMMQDNEAMGELMKVITEAIESFFPEQKEVVEEDSKESDEKN